MNSLNNHIKYALYKNYLSFCMFFITCTIDELTNAFDVDGHLEMGRLSLVQGQYTEALQHYHAACEKDPTNYLPRIQRATVYLALGKHRAALDDLNQVIELKPDFSKARFQRGTVLMKQGRLDEAHIDFEWVLRLEPFNDEANHAYSLIEPLKQDIQLAYMLMADKNWMEAIDTLTKLLHEMPWDVTLRELRSSSYERIGDAINAISDLRASTKMRSDNTNGYLKLSKLHYEIGEADESLNTIRECLKLDPDHKLCKDHYKIVKKLAAQLKAINDLSQEKSFTACAEKCDAAFKTEHNVFRIVQQIKAKKCHCLSQGGNAFDAISVCSEALKLDETDVNVLCDRAEAYIVAEDFDNALRDFKTAHDIDPHLSRAEEGLKKTQRLEKQSKSRDYYKILGVKRNADKKEIVKAYRALAAKWHPDNFQGDEKKTAEKKFIDIASAKEVLTDPEKRQKFDNGEDPLDPEQQSNQGFNPFGSHFHPFGRDSGQYAFKFTFS